MHRGESGNFTPLLTQGFESVWVAAVMPKSSTLVLYLHCLLLTCVTLLHLFIYDIGDTLEFQCEDTLMRNGMNNTRNTEPRE